MIRNGGCERSTTGLDISKIDEHTIVTGGKEKLTLQYGPNDLDDLHDRLILIVPVPIREQQETLARPYGWILYLDRHWLVRIDTFSFEDCTKRRRGEQKSAPPSPDRTEGKGEVRVSTYKACNS
jgi:hypothetical protein